MPSGHADATTGEELRLLRQLRGWSLLAAGNRWGISPSTLSRIERDLFMPDIVVAFRIFADLGMPVERWLDSPLARKAA